MFSYYGGKSKIANNYPLPRFQTIIEPFAGAAAYSLLYSDRSVLLNDLDPTIVKIWKYLRSAPKARIQNLPELGWGDTLKRYDLTEAERLLLGFAVNRGVSRPCNIVTEWSWMNDTIRVMKKRILRSNIRHWSILRGSYDSLPNIIATWFVDPPYQFARGSYSYDNIDYQLLAEWCRTRRGQVIVCEGNGANWLPFSPLIRHKGQRRVQSELIYVINQ